MSSISMSNYPGINVNIVERDMPIAHNSSVMLPLILASNDKLYVESWLIHENQYDLITFITCFDHFKSM